MGGENFTEGEQQNIRTNYPPPQTKKTNMMIAGKSSMNEDGQFPIEHGDFPVSHVSFQGCIKKHQLVFRLWWIFPFFFRLCGFVAFHDRLIDDVQDELWRWDLQEFGDAKPIPHEARKLPMWLLHYLGHGNGFDKGVLSFQVYNSYVNFQDEYQPTQKTKNCLTGQESMTCSFFFGGIFA